MKDFDRYSKEFFLATKSFSLRSVITSYQLPNSEELHSMICGYGSLNLCDETFSSAEAIDYFSYEKELWKANKK